MALPSCSLFCALKLLSDFFFKTIHFSPNCSQIFIDVIYLFLYLQLRIHCALPNSPNNFLYRNSTMSKVISIREITCQWYWTKNPKYKYSVSDTHTHYYIWVLKSVDSKRRGTNNHKSCRHLKITNKLKV